MQIKQALQLSKALEVVSDSAAYDVELMLCELLDKPASFLFTWPERELTSEQLERLQQMVERRKQGEPVAHIIGHRGFWSFELDVTPTTLIPRPDTEVLVEKVLSLDIPDVARVADLGTGTGAIALALATERPNWQVIASDLVSDAVALAERNRKKLGLDNVSVLEGSWFEPLQGEFDLLVSNPPYIDPDDPHLSAGDLRFEPDSALTAENKGMADIELIADQARHYLKSDGYLIFEHGYDQGELSRNLLKKLGYREVDTACDYGQNERITFGRWPGNSEK